MRLTEFIKEICKEALQQAFQDRNLPDSIVEITEATNPKFGHYQCNSAMKLTKVLGLNPRTIAEQWVLKLQSQNEATSSLKLFEKIEIAGPGFINFTLTPSYLSKMVNRQLLDPRFGIEKPKKRQKIIIDFSSPNIAKEMHVGHLRSTIIGDSLARVFRFLGHEVLPLNHIGDWGTQFGMLIAYLKTIPSLSLKNRPDIELSQLVEWYRASKERFDSDPDFKKEAQMEVVALQGGNPESYRIWEYICDISRIAYEHIYRLLDIQQLVERGESFYNLHLPDVIQDLENKKILFVSEGAKCVYPEGFINREGKALPLILQKSDGGYNYATTDLAALKHRIQDEKADWIIYVTDAGQNQHFQMVFETAKMAGIYNSEKTRVDHVPFGLVLRSDGKKFKTRSGDTERLIDLLQTAIEHSKETLSNRNLDISDKELEEASHILGIDAIKYADLSSHRLSDYIFSYEKMLKFEGNTAAFLLYAFVRIQSIKRKSKLDLEALKREHSQDTVSVILQDTSEIALGLLLCQFEDVIEKLTQELLPNRLTDYLYNLAEAFHVFFHQCRVEGSETEKSRLLLCEAVARVLKQGLELLGLKTLDRM